MCNEGYIFIRGSTWITWDKVSGQTGWYWWTRGMVWVDGWTRGMGGWVDLRNGWMGGLEEWVDRGVLII